MTLDKEYKRRQKTEPNYHKVKAGFYEGKSFSSFIAQLKENN